MPVAPPCLMSNRQAALAAVLCLLAALTSLAGYVTYLSAQRVAHATDVRAAIAQARFGLTTELDSIHAYIATRSRLAREQYVSAARDVSAALGRPRSVYDHQAGTPEDDLYDLHNHVLAVAERILAAAAAPDASEVELHAQLETDPHVIRLRSGIDRWMGHYDHQLRTSTEELEQITFVLWLGTPAVFLVGLLILSRIWRGTQVQRQVLAHRDGQLAEAQQLAQLGSWEWDLITGHLSWSAELWRIFGLEPEAYVPTYDAFLAIVHPEDVEQIRSVVEATLRTGEPFDRQLRVIRSDGEVRVVNARGAIGCDVTGRPVRMVGTAQDITERHQIEAALHERERSLRALVGSLDDVVFEFDGEGAYVNVWTSDETLLAAPRASLLGRRVAEILGDEVGGSHLHIFRRVLQTGRAETLEYSLDVGAGTRWFLASISPIRGVDGDHRTVSMLCRDITARKRAEEDLKERTRLAELSAEVGIALTGTADLRTMLPQCAEAMVCHLDAAFARIWTLDGSSEVLELQASAGMYTHVDGPHSRVPVGSLKIGLIASEGKPHLTNEVIGDPRVGDQEWARREGMVAFAGYPLVIADHTVGVMAMFARQPLGDLTVRALAAISSQIALGIERKQAEAERERLLVSEQAALTQLRATQQQVIQQERLRAL